MKPIKALAHGILDYGLASALVVIPPMIGVKKKNISLYQVLAANLGAYNALTDHGAAIKPLIPFRTHGKIDYGNLLVLGLLACTRRIREDKKARTFHSTILAAAAMNVLLTDFDD